MTHSFPSRRSSDLAGGVVALALGVQHEDRAGQREAGLHHLAEFGDGIALAADDAGKVGEDGVERARVGIATEEARGLGRQLLGGVWHDRVYLTRRPVQPSRGTASRGEAAFLSVDDWL